MHRLAKQMLERCLAYYESVGPHWLCSPRKSRTMQLLGLCVNVLEGSEAAEKVLLEGKRAATRELGPTHRGALQSTNAYADILLACGRKEASLSMLQKAARLRKETLGPAHGLVFECEVSVGVQISFASRRLDTKRVYLHVRACAYINK